MVDGCGYLSFGEKTGEDTFTVKLATKPIKDVVIEITSDLPKMIKITPDSGATFTPDNWNVAQTFKFKGIPDCDTCVQREKGYHEATVKISVDTFATQDAGQSGSGGHIFGYKDCVARVVATKKEKKKATPKAEGRRHLSDTAGTKIDCFSYTSALLTGKNDAKPDKSLLKLSVRVKDESPVDVVETLIYTGVGAGVVGGIVGAVFAVLAIIAAFVAVAVRKKRGEEHDRKEEMKQKADQAEGNIEFRVDAEMEDTGMEDLETTTSKLLGERDELIEVNKKLAEEVGESPMECAMTEDQDVLIEQIKGLKGENDRLRDLQSQTAKRNPKKSKKKREGFGEQQA